MRIQLRCELIKTDRISTSVTTARAGVGRARQVQFKGDDSSETELIIKGVTVSRDSLIQAAFLRQQALEQQHDSKLEYRYEKKHENTLTSESTESTSPTTEIVGPISENSLAGNMANGDKMVVTGSAAGLFAVERFCGNEEEDIEGFLDAVIVSAYGSLIAIECIIPITFDRVVLRFPHFGGGLYGDNPTQFSPDALFDGLKRLSPIHTFL